MQQFEPQRQTENQIEDIVYEELLPDGYSDEEGSWETQNSAKDGQGNVNTGEMSELTAAGWGKSMPNFTPVTRISTLNLSSPMLDIGLNMRMVPGASRRPISVDAGSNKRASRVKIEEGELDYAAYI
jgi:axial budding pattern protein 2